MTRIEQRLNLALDGDQRSLARLATLVENDPAYARQITALVYSRTGGAHIVGLTGPPGAGKSSLLREIASRIAARGQRIAIIAIDPTSPISRGAALGDRIRMSNAALSPGVFVRSVASRARHDGLAPAISALVHLFDAAGFTYVFVETVGSGQDQYEVRSVVQTLVLVQIPGTGDSVQVLKAGVMEVADIYAVNKSDLPDAQRVSRDLRNFLGLAHAEPGAWSPPIVLCSAETGQGIPALLNAIDQHREYLLESGNLEHRRALLARDEIERAAVDFVQQTMSNAIDSEIIDQVARREVIPEEAALIALRSALNEILERR